MDFPNSAKSYGVHDEKIPEPEPHEMGLQVSCCIYPEAAEEEAVWGAALPLRGRETITSRLGGGDHVVPSRK